MNRIQKNYLESLSRTYETLGGDPDNIVVPTPVNPELAWLGDNHEKTESSS